MTPKEELEARQKKLLEEYDSKVRSLFSAMEQESDEQKKAIMYREAKTWAMKANRIIRALYPQDYMDKVWEL